MNAKPVTVIATFQARPGREEDLRQELLGLIPTTRAEAGCLNYDLHRATDHPALFLFHENWTSKGDLDAHLAKPHLQGFLAKTAELLSEPPSITLWERIG